MPSFQEMHKIPLICLLAELICKLAVCAQCVAKPGSESLQACVDEVLISGQLELLVTDPFGNYVVQSMLENCSDDEVRSLPAAFGPVQVLSCCAGRHAFCPLCLCR